MEKFPKIFEKAERKSLNRHHSHFLLGLFLALLIVLAGCHPRSHLLEPELTYFPQKRQFHQLPPPFQELSEEELKTEWGKELKVGVAFLRDFDFYRAITAMKRALILMPNGEKARRMQTEYYITLCYFLGLKYQEAVETFEFGTLRFATSSFPAFRDLLIILYESYLKIDQCEKAQAILNVMERGDPDTALDLKLFSALTKGELSDVAALSQQHKEPDPFFCFVSEYECSSKSVRKAQILNAILPGAGYFYVGQKKTALTSFLLNACFIAACYHFFETGNWGAGIFTTSLEFGWYFGGINGAGLAAKEYNEWLYQNRAKDLMIERSIFPVLMLGTSF